VGASRRPGWARRATGAESPRARCASFRSPIWGSSMARRPAGASRSLRCACP